MNVMIKQIIIKIEKMKGMLQGLLHDRRSANQPRPCESIIKKLLSCKGKLGWFRNKLGERVSSLEDQRDC